MNVVLIIVDSLRKDHIGAYGNSWIKTPNLDALAKESLVFTRPYPESFPTIPARRAMYTGFRSFPFRNWEPVKANPMNLYGWQPIPAEQTTLAEILRDAGYGTMLITDTPHLYGPSMNFHRGFDVFDFIRGQERDLYRPLWMCPEEKIKNTLLTGNPEGIEKKMRQYFANTASRKTEEDWFAPRVFTEAATFLEGARGWENPFFLVVDVYDPHEPWDPPEKYVDLYDDPYDGPEPHASDYGDAGYLTERQLKRMKALYAGEVTMMDRWLGHFLDRMEALGFMENTMLMLVSDHGYAFGEHGVVGKVTSEMYPEIIDVPFLIRHPEGKGAGKKSDFYASTHDVAPTILNFLGAGSPSLMEGQDLNPILDGEEPAEPRPYFTASYHDNVWARDDDYVLISRNDGAQARLYDLKADPDQQENIAWRNRDVVERMYRDYVLKDAGGEPLPRY